MPDSVVKPARRDLLLEASLYNYHTLLRIPGMKSEWVTKNPKYMGLFQNMGLIDYAKGLMNKGISAVDFALKINEKVREVMPNLAPYFKDEGFRERVDLAYKVGGKLFKRAAYCQMSNEDISQTLLSNQKVNVKKENILPPIPSKPSSKKFDFGEANEYVGIEDISQDDSKSVYQNVLNSFGLNFNYNIPVLERLAEKFAEEYPNNKDAKSFVDYVNNQHFVIVKPRAKKNTWAEVFVDSDMLSVPEVVQILVTNGLINQNNGGYSPVMVQRHLNKHAVSLPLIKPPYCWDNGISNFEKIVFFDDWKKESINLLENSPIKTNGQGIYSQLVNWLSELEIRALPTPKSEPQDLAPQKEYSLPPMPVKQNYAGPTDFVPVNISELLDNLKFKLNKSIEKMTNKNEILKYQDAIEKLDKINPEDVLNAEFILNELRNRKIDRKVHQKIKNMILGVN